MFFPGVAIILTALGSTSSVTGCARSRSSAGSYRALLMLEIRDLRVHIGDHEIVHIDELDLPRGTRLGLVGESDRARR